MVASVLLAAATPDVVATDGERVQCYRVPVLQSHLHRLQVGVHSNIHTSDRAVHLGPGEYSTVR